MDALIRYCFSTEISRFQTVTKSMRIRIFLTSTDIGEMQVFRCCGMRYCCWLPGAQTSLSLPGRRRRRRLRGGPVQSGKVKERKRVQKVGSQARSFPQVKLRELGWMGRALEEVLGGVRGCLARGAEVIWGPAHPHQETVEGKTEARAELEECRAGKGGFLSRNLRGLVLQNYVTREIAERLGDCVGVDGADGFFV